ncbi:UDP-glucose/GDP-mannose dehydrogenase family protein [Luteimonas sp. RD2P54]|uniref:UDP-glucose 6-dehydrogenase n=1 Tax=Luteimonas endophytica TaxID=3042023 RepID=A0ABT6J830_9GAMM|nr:UDP-glucose/GDP-mannose dehydrogenase family protein [Luteimonas endophytica]MDH5822975.1 UDP-glucose/GDP-mannose dehydrogenase family protein [Luteimonas endophytica]
MKVSIFGTGYVGLVTGTCLSEIGHDVTCVDVDEAKIEGLRQGRLPIYEPGLDSMVVRNGSDGRLHFTTDAAAAIAGAEIVFIAVGTPPDEDGSADLQYVLRVAKTIGANLRTSAIVVNKSTVPVGTAQLVRGAIAGELSQRKVEIDFEVVSNPEFLKEGDAVNDCMHPDRIVIGATADAAVDKLKRLYAPFVRNHDRFVVMDVRSAELTKYAANAMLATKISFMNEISNIAERVGADIEMVRRGIGSDPRIGWQFIYPGVGYGGSCFPKDVQALARTAQQHGYRPQLLDAVEEVNERQKAHLFELIHRHFDGQLSDRTVAIWGLAFKPDTDDMRAASSRRLMEQLWAAGARVRAYDPEAMDEARRIYGERVDLVLCDSMEEALRGADALAVVTEWRQFRSPDLAAFRTLGDAVVFDGRNVYDPDELEQAGIAYYGIGRGRSVTGG